MSDTICKKKAVKADQTCNISQDSNPKPLPPKYFPHHLLVAMPSNHDDDFDGAVIYLYQHNAQGASGIIINKKYSSTLGAVMKQLNIEAPAGINSLPVLYGGPVNTENGFIIYPTHSVQEDDETSPIKLDIAPTTEDPLAITAEDPLAVTTARSDLEQIAAGSGPRKFIVSLGYTAWDAGQLEDELQKILWLPPLPYNEALLFDTPTDKIRARAVQLYGFNLDQLSTETGHA